MLLKVACEVISKWKAGLKEDIDVRSDVYVLSNGCRKNSDDNLDYYWEYVPGKCTWFGDHKGSEWYYSEGVTIQDLQRKVGTKFVGRALILSLENSLSEDCDVEKN
ncbi:hypothetical protein Tco_0068742, partial [Tanacetum coccineum]